MNFTLTMTFLTETGEKTNISISEVREDLSKAEALELMDTIIEKDVFITKKGALVSKHSASLTQKEVTKFDI